MMTTDEMLRAPQLAVKVSPDFRERFERFAATHHLTVSAAMRLCLLECMNNPPEAFKID